MHFSPDTSEADAAAESYWEENFKQENFKQVIRQDFREHVKGQLQNGMMSRMYSGYSERYADHKQFMDRIADMLTVGAENGTDAAFDDIFTAFLTESRLPSVRKYAWPLLPEAFPEWIQGRIISSVIEEYSQETVFTYAYRVGYRKEFPSFESLIRRVAELAGAGVLRGTDEMTGKIYQSFLHRRPLPPARRNPRRLKGW